jgi:hypothetical protein
MFNLQPNSHFGKTNPNIVRSYNAGEEMWHTRTGILETKNGGGLASSAVDGPWCRYRYAGSTATISNVSGSMIRISLRTRM